MLETLLTYYNRELTYLRRLAGDFAEAHPKIAGRLRLARDTVDDPHVERLIEAVAFLNARIRHKLDDDFPELTEALLGVLYPHYLAPIPSMAIVQLEAAADLAGVHIVPRGTEFDSEPVGGERCRFRSCYDTALWPIEIEAASLQGRPFRAPPNRAAQNAVAVLRVALRCRAPDMTFTALGPDSLRFFLRGPLQEVFPTYELLFNNCISVALADSSSDPDPVILGPDCIRPVGFEADESMLPYPARSFVGYRILTEYFAFPEKFLFFDLVRLSGKVLLEAGNRLEVFIYLNATSKDLERSISADSFALGCTPVVNLFSQRADPIRITHDEPSYRVEPNERRPAAMEIWSVDEVYATSRDGTETPYYPFYSVRHGAAGRRTFWFPSRRAAAGRRGTDIWLTLVDLDFDPARPADETLSVETTCLNRDLPSRLPFGGGHPYLELVDGDPAVTRIACLTAPTETLRPPLGDGLRWRLISHLSLNHLSLTDAEEGAEALREILRLYDFRQSVETQAAIDSILSVRCRPGAARAPAGGMDAICHGTDVVIEFDQERFSESGLFLLATVLERFLGLYSQINAYARLTATVRGRSGVLKRWPPRAGDRPLL